MKSWRVRYLVLDGADLRVAYFNSKSDHAAGRAPKGAFVLASVEKHDYRVGVLAEHVKPFGFKLVGHAPAKGYVELDVFVDTLEDLVKWVDIAQTALAAAKRLTKDPALSPAKPRGKAPPPPPTTQQQLSKLGATKEELLRAALKEIEVAKGIGDECLSEVAQQGGTYRRLGLGRRRVVACLTLRL